MTWTVPASGATARLALLLLAAVPAAAAPPEPLEIGVLPYVGVDELVQAYGPLARHLERELGRPARIVTAPDYPELLARTARREYPLLVTGSHFARLAQLDSGYTPVLRPTTSYHALLLVRSASPFRRIEELRGRTIFLPDDLSQTAIMGRVLLQEHGVDDDTARLETAGNHKNALLALLEARADACVVSEGAFRHMREEDRRDLRELPPTAGAPREGIPVVYVVSPLVPEAERERLVAAIARFANELPEGRAWIGKLRYGALRPVTEAELRSLDGDVRVLRRALARRGHGG